LKKKKKRRGRHRLQAGEKSRKNNEISDRKGTGTLGGVQGKEKSGRPGTRTGQGGVDSLEGRKEEEKKKKNRHT